MTAENRQFERRNIRIPVMCWETDNGRPQGRGTEAITRDLSAGGLSIGASSMRPLDSHLLAELHLPGRKNPVVTRARVARIETLLGEEGYLLGLAFDGIEQQDQDFVRSCLEGMDLYSIIERVIELDASDLHLTVSRPPVVRVNGELRTLEMDPIQDGQVMAMIYPLLSRNQIAQFEKTRELDFAFSPSVQSRFRVNLHYQRGFLEAALRSVPPQKKSFHELELPVEALQRFCRTKSGLVLIAGTTGSGKTTTMATMVDYLNQHLERVVITIEDPIEFTHASVKSIVKQRELGSDTNSYSEALRRSLRQDPDVIVVGELSDSDCVLAALRAAETGHLVISTVHAPDTEQAVERIINLFAPEHAASVCQQLSSCLVGILYQVLVPATRGGRILATELLMANFAVRNLIREKKFAQLGMCIQTGREAGMHTLQSRLQALHRRALIDDEVVRDHTKR